jgi:hypothetical protein
MYIYICIMGGSSRCFLELRGGKGARSRSASSWLGGLLRGNVALNRVDGEFVRFLTTSHSSSLFSDVWSTIGPARGSRNPCYSLPAGCGLNCSPCSPAQRLKRGNEPCDQRSPALPYDRAIHWLSEHFGLRVCRVPGRGPELPAGQRLCWVQYSSQPDRHTGQRHCGSGERKPTCLRGRHNQLYRRLSRRRYGLQHRPTKIKGKSEQVRGHSRLGRRSVLRLRTVVQTCWT